MLSNLLWNLISALGTLLTVVFFVIGWRQTIGAKRERIIAINAEVKRVLMRRAVLEEYRPSFSDIARLIEGKATDNKISANELLSERQILNILYSQVFDNDLILAEKKNDILKHLDIAFTSEDRSAAESKAQLGTTSRGFTSFFQGVNQSYRIGLLAAAGGTITAGLVYFPAAAFVRRSTFSPIEVLPKLLATFGASLAAIVLISILDRLRRSAFQDYSKGGELSSNINFENRVGQVIHSSKACLMRKDTFAEGLFDFLVDFNGKRIGIEAKNWIDPLPRGVLEEVIKRVQDAKSRSNTDQVILVSRQYMPPAPAVQSDDVRIMSLQDLKTYLR